MPNVNFTSSSFAQQDRYAQTTVSYESRNMQAIPFYPDVDHKAKFRGILVLTLLCSIVIGALFGLIYGYRDVLFSAAESSGIFAWFGGNKEEETAAVEEENIDFSLAAWTSDSTNSIIAKDAVWQYVYDFKNKSDNFDGEPHALEHWDNPIIKTAPYGIDFYFKYQKTGTSDIITADALDEWPTQVGTYKVSIIAVPQGGDYAGVEFSFPYDVFITIGKLPGNEIPFPDFTGYPVDGTDYEYGKTYPLSIKDKTYLNKYGIPEENVGWTIEYTPFIGNKEIKDSSKISISDAGHYKITMYVKDTYNTEPKTFNDANQVVEFTIDRAMFPNIPDSDLLKQNQTFTYSPNNAKSLSIIASKLPHGINISSTGKDKVGYIYSYEGCYDENCNCRIVFKENKAIDHGKYRVAAKITSNNYREKTVYANFQINKATLDSFYTKNYGSSMVYDGKCPEDSDGIFMNIKASMPEYITINYTFYKNGSSVKLGSIKEIVNVGSYQVQPTVVSTDPANNYIIPTLSKYTFTVKKAVINLDNVTVTTFTDTYTGDRFYFPKENVVIKGLPAGEVISIIPNSFAIDRETNESTVAAVDAGKYDFNITLSGKNYESTTVTGTVVIEKASFDGILNLKLNNQVIKKDGKEHLPTVPKYSFIDGFEPVDFDIYFAYDGKQISLGAEGGAKTLGDHKMMLVAYDKNHESSYPVTLTIEFNPMSIIMGIVLGIILGIFVALFILMGYRALEKHSYQSFRGVRLRLLQERGGDRGAIVCEGRVMILNWNSEQEHRDFPWLVEPRFGRLFLTHSTLEYYDSSCSGKNIKTYKNYRNFLVQLKEVTGVEIRGLFFRSKLIVFARGARHVFYVEPNTAYLWRRDILHFRDLVHLYPMENNVVDNNYPFNYAVIKSSKTTPQDKANNDLFVPDNI